MRTLMWCLAVAYMRKNFQGINGRSWAFLMCVVVLCMAQDIQEILK